MLAPLALVAVLSGVSALALAWALRNLARARKSRSWPTVDATILASQVVSGPKGARPKVSYTYQFDGTRHESARIVVGGMWETSGDGPARIVRQFAKGSVAQAAVDPEDPGYSVLIPGIRVHQVLTAFFCGVAFAGILTMSIVLARLVLTS